MHTRGMILEKVLTNYVSMVKWSHRKKITQPPNSPAHLNSFLMKSNTDHSANFIKKKSGNVLSTTITNGNVTV